MKIGIIGNGNIAKKHQAAIASLDGVQLEAIYDLVSMETPENVEAHTDLNSFLDSDIDLVVVCSPNGMHKEHSIKALNAGHDVICEKPFALAKDDCNEMISVAKNNQRQLFCTMQNRYSPVSQWLKKIMIDKALGETYLVNVSCYWNRNKNYYQQSQWRGSKAMDGGTLFTQFSHYVDTLYWLFGDMQILNAHFSNFDHDEMIDFEDTGIFNFIFDKGGMGTFSYTTSCYEKNFESSLAIIGSKGTIKVAGQYMDRVTYANIQDVSVMDLPPNDNLENIRSVYKNAISKIREKKEQYNSAEDALRVVDLIERVYSYRKKTL